MPTGKRCLIKSNVTLKGPVIVGNNTIIEHHTLICKSIVLDNTYISRNLEVKNSIVNKK